MGGAGGLAAPAFAAEELGEPGQGRAGKNDLRLEGAHVEVGGEGGAGGAETVAKHLEPRGGAGNLGNVASEVRVYRGREGGVHTSAVVRRATEVRRVFRPSKGGAVRQVA